MTPKELLLKVKQHILKEPLRLNMNEGLIVDVNEYLVNSKAKPEEYVPSGIAPCNTVGCIAGWCCMLSETVSIRTLGDRSLKPWSEVKSTAAILLGFNYSFQLDELFYQNRWPRDLALELQIYTPGTPEYAAVVAKRIDRFIAENYKDA